MKQIKLQAVGTLTNFNRIGHFSSFHVEKCHDNGQNFSMYCISVPLFFLPMAQTVIKWLWFPTHEIFSIRVTTSGTEIIYFSFYSLLRGPTICIYMEERRKKRTEIWNLGLLFWKHMMVWTVYVDDHSPFIAMQKLPSQLYLRNSMHMKFAI